VYLYDERRMKNGFSHLDALSTSMKYDAAIRLGQLSNVELLAC
jgi:hypothetical protein